MGDHVLADVEDLAEGERLVTEVDGRRLAVFKVDGEYRAYHDRCPHQGGPVCQGTVTGTYETVRDESESTQLRWGKDGRILNCPWHGWEFDLSSGECLSREKVELRSYPVDVEDGKLVVTF